MNVFFGKLTPPSVALFTHCNMWIDVFSLQTAAPYYADQQLNQCFCNSAGGTTVEIFHYHCFLFLWRKFEFSTLYKTYYFGWRSSKRTSIQSVLLITFTTAMMGTVLWQICACQCKHQNVILWLALYGAHHLWLMVAVTYPFNIRFHRLSVILLKNWTVTPEGWNVA